MPVLSDFTVVTKSDFISRRTNTSKRYRFNTGGRHNTRAVLDVALFGGYRNGDQSLTVRIDLNGRRIGTASVNRWQSHSTIVHDRINLIIEPSILISGNNTLRIEPLWEGNSDYLFVGPVVCHFHQRD